MKPGGTSNIPRILRQALKVVQRAGDAKDKKLVPLYQLELERTIEKLEQQESSSTQEVAQSHE